MADDGERLAFEVPEALAGVRLDRAVALVGDVARTVAAALVDEGAVTVDGRIVRDRGRRLRRDEHVSIGASRAVPRRPSAPAPRGASAASFATVHEDDAILVIDKPPGVVVHAGAGHLTGTLSEALQERYPELASLPARGAGSDERPGIVHRLDKDTSGLLVVARTADAYRSLTAQLASRRMGRGYIALVTGRIEADRGVVDAPIGRSTRDPTKMVVAAGGRGARTRYEVRLRFEEPVVSLVELGLETGRTHQIRVHMAAIGHPVLGDEKYGGVRGALSVPRCMLHAQRLELDHPATGERAVFEVKPPSDFESVLSVLRGEG